MKTSTSPLRKSLQVTYSVPLLPSMPICGNPIARDTPGMPAAPPKYGGPTSNTGRDGSKDLPPSRDTASVTLSPSFQITYCVPSGAIVPMPTLPVAVTRIRSVTCPFVGAVLRMIAAESRAPESMKAFPGKLDWFPKN